MTRAVSGALARCALTFIERRPIDIGRAVEQHRAYCETLREAGLSVVTLPAEDDLPDAVFVEDAAVVLNEVAVVARPGTESRRGEVESVAEATRAYRAVERIEEPGTLDGGDVLPIGQEVFVGLSTRTNEEGARQFEGIVKRLGYRVHRVEVRGCLHLKSAVGALDPETVLIRAEWIDAEPFARFRQIAVPDAEPFAADALAIGNVIYLSASWPRTHELLHRNGFRTHALDLSEFEKAEAGPTCLSLIVGL